MLFTAAVQNTAAANALVIVASNTAFSSLFSYILLGELTPFRMWVTTFICFGAIALIFSGKAMHCFCATGNWCLRFSSVTHIDFFRTSGGAGGGSGDFLGSILAVISAITQGLFFSLIRYKYTKGIDVSNTDILCYNVIASFSVCVGKQHVEREIIPFNLCLTFLSIEVSSKYLLSFLFSHSLVGSKSWLEWRARCGGRLHPRRWHYRIGTYASSVHITICCQCGVRTTSFLYPFQILLSQTIFRLFFVNWYCPTSASSFFFTYSYLILEPKAGGFGLLVIGPSYLPANEVSLFFLIETFVGMFFGRHPMGIFFC